MSVKFGIDVFLNQATTYQRQRFALVTNHAATTDTYIPSRQVLLETGFQIIKLFSPEHGLDTVGDDGALMPNGMDVLTGLPIVSLYGDKLKPSAEDVADVDAVLLDLPDVGCRFYTYLWTLTHVMEACATYGKPLIVLDRPNPISGRIDLAEGPMLDETNCASFLGRWTIPLRHSCTFGELATFWQKQRLPDLELTVIQVEDWQRSGFAHDWQSSFVPTSPAMVSAEAALLYPGTGLLEATNLSEGRGTATPFLVAGAPWLDAYKITTLFNDLSLKNVVARAVTFTPQSSRYVGERCQGVMFHVTNVATFRPVLSGMLFIKLVYGLQPKHFAWATYPTHVNPTGRNHLDRLLGTREAETLFEKPLPEFTKTLHKLLACEAWQEQINPVLLY